LAHIVAIVAAVFFTLGGRTITCWMRAFFILSHFDLPPHPPI